MKCPKCGTTLVKSNDGKYLCTPECKSIYDEKDLKEKTEMSMSWYLNLCLFIGFILIFLGGIGNLYGYSTLANILIILGGSFFGIVIGIKLGHPYFTGKD